MKICLAQAKSIKGDIAGNIINHLKIIEIAGSFGANSIFFPELSLSNYEPKLAKNLAIEPDDSRLLSFQNISDNNKITIGIGIPLKIEIGVQIAMAIFQPNKPIISYSKQQLHPDEFPYFVSGEKQIIIKVQNVEIAPAICYESLQINHIQNAKILGAELYLASVAKSQNQIENAFKYYSEIAKSYSMPVAMTNCLGFCDDFLGVGQSAVWNKDGRLLGQLDHKNEGILVFDTDTEEVVKFQF
jgi:predicted amidohydrolase